MSSATTPSRSVTGGEATSPAAQAVLDMAAGLRAWDLWSMLGWQDIRRRYRRSKLGPFWLTISMGVLVGALGVLYAGLFRVDVADYLPFIATGFIVWAFIASLITEGCDAFIAAERIVKQIALPLSVYVYRTLWRNLIVLAHNSLIYVVVVLAFAVEPGWMALLALPGLVLLCLNGLWVGLLLGLVCARFRDVPPIAASVVQVAFFLTPIIWKPELLPDRAPVLDLNPFYHVVELVRAPLLGQVPALHSWLAVAGFALAGWLLTLIMYRRFRWRIAYWL